MVHVLDASRGVPVAQTLLDKTRSLGFVEVRQAGTVSKPRAACWAESLSAQCCPLMKSVAWRLMDFAAWSRLQDVKEEYAEMREEFLAGLEDRRYLTIAEARAKRLQVRRSHCLRPACHAHVPSKVVPSSGPAGLETG